MNRVELVNKIEKAKMECASAGAVHKRDLQKHIKRLERELHDYDRFQNARWRG